MYKMILVNNLLIHRIFNGKIYAIEIFCVLGGTSVLSHFFLLGGTSSILRTFLVGPVKRNTLYKPTSIKKQVAASALWR